jgi:membrane associated rhomboid family serine protease
MIITLAIIAITVVVSIAAMDNHTLKNKLMFNAYQIHHRKEWYRFFSNGLIHADWLHLILNMYVFFIFGRNVEAAFASDFVYGSKGQLFYILLYIGGLVMSSLYSYEKHKHNIYYNALGASGAVNAVMFAFIILAPTAKMGLFLIPIAVPAYLFGLIILALEHFLSRRGNSTIGHDAHFWGAIFGALFTIALKPQLAIDFIDKIMGRY